MSNPVIAPVLGWLGKLSFPRLFLLTAVLFILNTMILDPIPFVDEILLGLGTLLLSRWKKKPGSERAPIDGEVRR